MSTEQPSEAPIRRYLAVLKRRSRIFVAVAVLIPCAAVGYSLSQSELYEASSTVLVNRQSVANQLSGSADIGLQQQSFQQVLVTQSRLARTPDVLRSALRGAGNAGRRLSVEGLQRFSSVEADPDSDLLTFDVVRPDAAEAKRLALSYSNAFVRYRRTLDSMALNRALKDVNTALAEAGATSRGLSAPVDRLTASKQQLETRLALQSANAQVVAAPEEAAQIRPRPLRSGVLGAVLGLVMALVAVFLRDALDTRVRTSAEAEALLGTPILSRIPRPREGRTDAQGLAMLVAPHGAAAEAFRILRGNLTFGLLSSEAKVVMVTSSAQAEGKSTTIANLAVAHALAGKRVALVDLDLRRPSLAKLFGVSPAPGVAGVALGQASLSPALKSIQLTRADDPTSHPRTQLDVLASGALPPAPSEFINSDAVRGIVRVLREQYDLVLIDAPPLVHVSDTSIIADLADAVFVCVRLGIVRRSLLESCGRV